MAAWVALLCETAPAATVDVGAVVIGAEVVESSGEKIAEVELESAAVLEVAAAAEVAAAVVAAA
jgi:phosphate/sulfate permease